MLKAIYNRIRLLRLRSKEPYSVYYRILGFMPDDLSIYEQAFLHRSSSIKTEKGKWINNERLEFLGDAVLDAIIADVVFHEFETKKEGFLTNTRSKIVQRETLNKLALELGLDKLVVSSTRTSSHNNYMYGNAFEAFIGAIYIDQGYDVCKKFIDERVIAPYLNLAQIARKEVNFKSKLIEWSQKNKVKIEFELIESFTDGDNNPVFQTQILVCDIPGGIGTGYSKKESQQNAAKATLKKIQSDKTFQDALASAREEIRLREEAEQEITDKGVDQNEFSSDSNETTAVVKEESQEA
ncbi:MAG: ribonuclease III [Bacteroidales bacterium]